MSRNGVLHAGQIPDRIVDLLRVDCGWLTKEGIALDVEADPMSVYQALFRLRRRGLVKSRRVDHLLEWRAV